MALDNYLAASITQHLCFTKVMLLILLGDTVAASRSSSITAVSSQHGRSDLTVTVGDVTYNLVPVFGILFLLYLLRIGALTYGKKQLSFPHLH